jgi:hypothetical protein
MMTPILGLAGNAPTFGVCSCTDQQSSGGSPTPPPVALPIIDTINRADDPTGMGSTENPVIVWEQYTDGAELIGVKDHAFYSVTHTGNNCFAVVETGRNSGYYIQAQVTMDESGYDFGLSARFTDLNNRVRLQTYSNGDGTYDVKLNEIFELTGYPGPRVTIDYVPTSLRLEDTGSSIKGFVNGNQVVELDTIHNQGTKIGHYFAVDNENYRISNIRIGSLTAQFSPLEWMGLNIFLRSSDITGFVNDSDLTSWVDSSGNHRITIPVSGVGDIAPKYRTNIKNGLPGVFFSNNNNVALSTDLNITSEPFTIFAVYNYADNTSGGHRAVHGQGNNWLLGAYNNAYQAFGGSGFAANPPAATQNRFISQVVTQSGGVLSNYVNGVLAGTVSASTVPGILQIGAYGGETTNGYILEAGALGYAAAAQQIADFTTYANTTYALS